MLAVRQRLFYEMQVRSSQRHAPAENISPNKVLRKEGMKDRGGERERGKRGSVRPRESLRPTDQNMQGGRAETEKERARGERERQKMKSLGFIQRGFFWCAESFLFSIKSCDLLINDFFCLFFLLDAFSVSPPRLTFC